MFGLKKFNDTKTKKFGNDKMRKQKFAIKTYYKSKTTAVKTKDNNSKNRIVY